MARIIIASGPVIVENNRVLLSQHGDTEFWKFCGGQNREGESLVETAARRAKEELGIDIEITDQHPYLTHTIKETGQEKIDVVLVHYSAQRKGEVKPGADIRRWDWIPLENLDKENLAPNILPALEHFGFLT